MFTNLPATITFTDDTAANTVLFTVTGSDADPLDSPTLSMITTTVDFSFDPATGWLFSRSYASLSLLNIYLSSFQNDSFAGNNWILLTTHFYNAKWFHLCRGRYKRNLIISVGELKNTRALPVGSRPLSFRVSDGCTDTTGLLTISVTNIVSKVWMRKLFTLKSLV